MVNFPTLESLRVERYELYPGTSTSPGFDADFSAAATVIVGANGLGKSTLLRMAFRLLTGPFDIPGANSSGDRLGAAKLDAKQISPSARSEFAARVGDGAKDAKATLTFRLGHTRYEVSRLLRNLSLVAFTVDGKPVECSENFYQLEMCRRAGLSSFSDFILVLRYVSFFMDDRQVLFWDRSAQKQLLRSLFLPPAEAETWTKYEREVLTLDSRHRNVRNVFNSEKKALAAKIEPGAEGHAALRTQLIGLLDDQEVEGRLTRERHVRITELEDLRAEANLNRLLAQKRLDELAREYEGAKVEGLRQAFPSNSESALFIWTQLLSEHTCLVCGHEAHEMQTLIQDRIDAGACAVCGHDQVELDTVKPGVSKNAVGDATDAWEQLESQRIAVQAFQNTFTALTDEISELTEVAAVASANRASRESRILALQGSLPADDGEYVNARTQLEALAESLAGVERDLHYAAERFESLVQTQSAKIANRAAEVKLHFDRYAKLFLLEQGELTWTPRLEQLGQSSYRVAFPAYELQMTQNGAVSTSVRNGPEDVSESQKEFIDLAFRMALVEVAGDEQKATLIVDTPESSLDTVFADRAARVLADFASTQAHSRLLTASNLTDGQLVPKLMQYLAGQSASSRLVNLLDIARPTAAVSALRGDYDAAMHRLEAALSGTDTEAL